MSIARAHGEYAAHTYPLPRVLESLGEFVTRVDQGGELEHFGVSAPARRSHQTQATVAPGLQDGLEWHICKCTFARGTEGAIGPITCMQGATVMRSNQSR